MNFSIRTIRTNRTPVRKVRTVRKTKKAMNEHRYKLEPYKGINSRYICPGCQQREKTFSLYIDAITCEHINPSVGRCNRESNCGYHYTPKQYFQDNNISFDSPLPKLDYGQNTIKQLIKPVSFIPVDDFKNSLKDYNENHFITFLNKLFGVEVATNLISKYFIGSSKHWPGATIFWQIDKQGKIRTGKIMLYSPSTGKRIKEPFSHIQWVHKVLNTAEFKLQQCLFGEHLLNYKSKPVAIVESEKTAIIASVYLPMFIWLAVGSLSNLNVQKCQALSGRNVFLFPDLNGFDSWKEKSNQISKLMPGTLFKISDYLQTNATDTDKQKGLDLADYLVKFDYKDFINSSNKAEIETGKPAQNQPEAINEKFENSSDLKIPVIVSGALPLNALFKPFRKEFAPLWDIVGLEAKFKALTIPALSLRLNQCAVIDNVQHFIDSHIEIIKNNNGNRIFAPYYQRLIELIQVMTAD